MAQSPLKCRAVAQFPSIYTQPVTLHSFTTEGGRVPCREARRALRRLVAGTGVYSSPQPGEPGRGSYYVGRRWSCGTGAGGVGCAHRDGRRVIASTRFTRPAPRMCFNDSYASVYRTSCATGRRVRAAVERRVRNDRSVRANVSALRWTCCGSRGDGPMTVMCWAAGRRAVTYSA